MDFKEFYELEMQVDACKCLAIIALRVRHDMERDLYSTSTGSLLYKCRTPPNVSDLHSPAYPPRHGLALACPGG